METNVLQTSRSQDHKIQLSFKEHYKMWANIFTRKTKLWDKWWKFDKQEQNNCIYVWMGCRYKPGLLNIYNIEHQRTSDWTLNHKEQIAFPLRAMRIEEYLLAGTNHWHMLLLLEQSKQQNLLLLLGYFSATLLDKLTELLAASGTLVEVPQWHQ